MELQTDEIRTKVGGKQQWMWKTPTGTACACRRYAQNPCLTIASYCFTTPMGCSSWDRSS